MACMSDGALPMSCHLMQLSSPQL
ncbi:hypothetical protein CCACVL1_28175 [Corchorus capsularis]|uniref:Uncharacterized protein n=1 Tax=Corchorus capsularis TaxID=210143 RepID=A0A1R3G7H6_COCAP|nr:hypothetical protein CCACVL1_28175 [Corchorus capsularis]